MTVRQEHGEKYLYEYEDVDTDSSLFVEIGADFVAHMAGTESMYTHTIGDAPCLLFAMRDAVDFGVSWYVGRDNI